ncbi:MAG: isocitrate/isopropylmalate dehydrogenase family protein [Fimbriimonadaceae bacterium]|nr:isocitrate/isopropylmalate dehydrogenase family protein [Fimbriimonadaceae bacterium]
MAAKHTVVLVPGDGIGPEITGAVLRILAAAGVEIEWERHVAGTESLATLGTPLPDTLLAAIEKHGVALKGPLTTPVASGFPSVNVALRKHFDLYANLRPVKTLPGMATHHGEIDLVIVRENTEDLYSGLEHVVVPGVVESLKIITEKACTRIAEFGFQFAEQNGRQTVSAVHKANIMKLSDGLFLDCCRKVATRHGSVAYNEVIVDNAAMQLVMRPRQFDTLLLENLYGDILSDLCAGLVGGLGLCPGANLGPRCAIFEAVHGSAPDIAGLGVANPTALLLAALLMLRQLEERAAADRIEAALVQVMQEPARRTRDLGGEATTSQFAEAIAAVIEAG